MKKSLRLEVSTEELITTDLLTIQYVCDYFAAFEVWLTYHPSINSCHRVHAEGRHCALQTPKLLVLTHTLTSRLSSDSNDTGHRPLSPAEMREGALHPGSGKMWKTCIIFPITVYVLKYK